MYLATYLKTVKLPVLPKTAMINHLAREQNWQTQLNTAVTDPVELLNLLKLPLSLLNSTAFDGGKFGLRVPRPFIERMQAGNARDPLLLQVLPLHSEQAQTVHYSVDPLGEQAANTLPGILHKYHSRLLLTITGACAVNCRYCFRRHFPYQDNIPHNDDWPRMAAYIEQHSAINEVILSGGDPLAVSNRRLAQWIERLETLPQLTTLRIHSRLPIVIPARLDDELLQLLTQTRLNVVLVVHANHPQELDAETKRALKHAVDAGILVLNQTVLLAGINDHADTLAALSHALFDCRVLPYYLHVLDKVQGAAHFDIPEQRVIELYTQLLTQLSGYLVPRLVREIAGQPFKVPLDLGIYTAATSDDSLQLHEA